MEERFRHETRYGDSDVGCSFRTDRAGDTSS